MSTLIELYALANKKYQRISDIGSEAISNEEWKGMFEEAMAQMQGTTTVMAEAEISIVTGNLTYPLPVNYHSMNAVYLLGTNSAYEKLEELPKDYVARIVADGGGFYYITEDGYYYVTDES